MKTMIDLFIVIGILPPQVEIFKGLSPHLGMTLEILRLVESRDRGVIQHRARADSFRTSALV